MLYEAAGRVADWYSDAERVYVSRELTTRIAGSHGARVIHNGVEAPAEPRRPPDEYRATRKRSRRRPP